MSEDTTLDVDGPAAVLIRGADGAVASPVTTWVFEPRAFTPLAKLGGRKRYGVVTDHLGTQTMRATEAGKIAWQAQLDVYGVVRDESLAAAGADAAEEAERTSNPWRYPGQYEDAETGLYYNRFRYYDYGDRGTGRPGTASRTLSR